MSLLPPQPRRDLPRAYVVWRRRDDAGVLYRPGEVTDEELAALQQQAAAMLNGQGTRHDD